MTTSKIKIWAIVPAAGSGTRLGSFTPKQYLKVNGKTLIEHAIAPLLEHSDVVKVVVPLSKDDSIWQTLSISNHSKIMTTVGGSERCDSVREGMKMLTDAKQNDWVLVHDAVRPCFTTALLQSLIDGLVSHDVGGLLALPPSDTLKLSDEMGCVKKTIDRSNLWRAQTPQMFRLSILSQAYGDKNIFTDESAAIEALGLQPKLIPSSPINIKVTQVEDLTLVKKLLAPQRSMEIY